MKTQQFLRIITPTLILVVVSLLALVTGCTLSSPVTLTNTPQPTVTLPPPTATPVSPTDTPQLTLTPTSPTATFTSTASIPLLVNQLPDPAVRTHIKISNIHAMAVEADYVWAATNGGVLRWNSADDRYVVYTTADGLASNNVWRIAIDKTGNVWAGTDRGLSRFDGQAWTTYPQVEGHIGKILFDRREQVWVETVGDPADSLHRFDGQTWTTYTVADTRALYTLWFIAEDKAGNVWIGGASDKISRFDGNRWTDFTVQDGLVKDYGTGIVADEDNHVWVLTEHSGIFEFDGRKWVNHTTENGFAGNLVYAMTVDPAGQRWFATNQGVSRFDGQTWTTYTTQDGLPTAAVRIIAVDEKGEVWAGTDQGASRFDGQGWITYTHENGLAGDYVRFIRFDRKGEVWVGTPQGISRFDGRAWRTYTTQESLLNNDIIDMVIDQKDQVWINSPGGMNRFDGNTWISYPFSGPVGNSITAVAVDRAGDLWVGTERRGLSRFDGQTWQAYATEDILGDNHINVIATDEAGDIWVGAGSYRGGLSRFDGQSWTTYTAEDGLASISSDAIATDAGYTWVGTSCGWYSGPGVSRSNGDGWTTYTTEDGLSHDCVNAIAVDRKGTVWFGTADGISKFDGDEWTTYTTEDGLAHKWVNAIVVDQTGRKWFGTGGGGISMFDDHTWTTYTAADGLASNVIYTLTVDQEGYILVGTYGGVSKFDGTTWTTYTTHDGLPSNKVNALTIDQKGHLWVGTENGLAEVDTSHWIPSSIIPTVIATPITSTQPLTIEVVEPRLADDKANQIYAQGKVNGQEKTLVLNWTDERLLATYNLVGELALDKENGWLYIDQKHKGLAVVNTHTQRLHTFISLPQSQYAANPSPQADPATGQVIVFRDNVVYIIDPEIGSIVDTIASDVIKVDSNTGPIDQVPPSINWTAYDPVKRILYIAPAVSYASSTAGSFTGYMIISYDMATRTEITRARSSMFAGSIIGGYLYRGQFYCVAALCEGKRWIWREGQPWFTSEGWRDGGSPIDLDPKRRLLYEVTDGNLRVFDAETMALTWHGPRPYIGTFEGYDPNTDGLLFRRDGQLQSWPVSNIQPPSPEPLTVSAVPTTSVWSLIVSPNWGADQTLFGIWIDPIEKASYDAPSFNCLQGNQRGHLLYMSQDSGQTWGQPLGGLRGSCERFTALAVSPDYARDHTLLAGVFGLGIFKSTDGGKLWQPSGTGLTEMNISNVVLSPDFANDHTAFAGWSYSLRSTDGGGSWQHLKSSQLANNEYLRAWALSSEFGQDHTLMRIISDYTQESVALHFSRDAGESWTLIGKMPREVRFSLLSMAPLFSKWQTLFAYGWNQGQEQGELHRSVDGGHSWQIVLTTDAYSARSLVYAPDIEYNRPVFLLAGETVYRSGDGGQNWAEFELPDGIVPTALAISPSFAQDGLLFVGTADGQMITVEEGK
ncbi:two-component regulator propeller domain-containing protein [Chloroflexota bacterium]